jgi:hypothetical protein
MLARVDVRKAFGVACLASVVAFVIFALIHAYVIRAAYPALTAATTTLAAFIAGFLTYVVVRSARAGSGKGETRLVFRILAGILAAFVLLIGLPAALSEARSGVWQAWLCAFCCLYAGVGLAVSARTGRWIYFRKSNDTRA